MVVIDDKLPRGQGTIRFAGCSSSREVVIGCGFYNADEKIGQAIKERDGHAALFL